MPRRPLLALALLSALTGCVSAPPEGPFVEYHAGLTPITRAVPCSGTYVLNARDQPSATGPLLTKETVEGERIGFRREEDGSVTAIARGNDLPLPPGAYAWELVPGTTPPWRDRFRAKTGAVIGNVVQTSTTALATASLAVAMIGLSLVYAIARGNNR